MTRKFFGTDGIRGEVGVWPVTPDFVVKLGWAAGTVFARHIEHGKKSILIGKDTRISGYMFESALEAGIIAAGVDVGLLGPMPTPAIAYLTRTLKAQAGIVISASHNPYYDNGIKFFSADGRKLPDAIEHEIEAQLECQMTTRSSAELGKAFRVTDAIGRYIEFCKSTVPATLHLDGMKIAVDCANGATYHSAPNVLRELGAEVIELAVDPNGININDQCGSTYPAMLQREVVAHGADLGIAFDGDGDRVLFVDHRGELLDGDEILYVIARDRLRRNLPCAGVVGTLMSNLGLEQSLGNLDVAFMRTNVGDRYVTEAMKQTGWTVGGEASGHILCHEYTTTGDAIVSALQVLFAVVDGGRSLHELKQGMTKYPQVMINVRLTSRPDLHANAQITAAVKDAEAVLAERGRVLLRPSGTEPLVRVMVEGQDALVVRKLAEQLAAVVEAEFGN